MTKKTQDTTMFKVSETDNLFNLIKTKEGIVITAGKFKVSNKNFKTYKDAEEYLQSKPYEILINVAVLFTKLNLEDETKKEPSAENTQSDK